ncbi:MAG: hypothetical protein ACOX6E_09440 [Syntrophomonadaceae bacterium]|jgi:hypothetical protein
MVGKQVFRKIAINAIKNIIIFGAIAYAIMLILERWRTLAIILGVIYAIIVFISLITAFLSFNTGMSSITLAIQEKKKGNIDVFQNYCWLWAGSAIRIVEETIYLLFAFNLYRALL